jgi:hypothetical protein
MSEEHRVRTLVHNEVPRRAESPPAVTRRDHRRGDARWPVPRGLEAGEVGRLLTMLLEAYDGRRPVPQIRGLVAPEVLAGLSGPHLARPRHRLCRVHVCTPVAGVLEACARVEAAGRSFALAARFARTPAGWQCVRFSLLKPGRPDQRAQRPAAA